MDKNQRVFDRISDRMPEHLRENLTKEIVDTSEEELAIEALKMDISPEARAEIHERLESGSFRTSETVENEDIIAQVDAYNERAVRDAIASGELPDPNSDPFIQERNRRMEARGEAPTEYGQFMEVIKAAGNIKVLRDLVLIHPESNGNENASGIIIVQKKQESQETGRVFKVGKEVKNVEEGKRVLINRFQFDTFVYQKLTFRIGKESDIIAVYE